jgi:MFS family permease
MAGILFLLTQNFFVLLIAATIGVISPSGNEVGPFLSIEQASLSQLIPDQRRTGIFAWYNLVGSFATALGAAFSGLVVQFFQNQMHSDLAGYQAVIAGYAVFGLLLAALFQRLSPAIEVTPRAPGSNSAPAASRGRLGLGASRGIILRLSALFSLDAFAGGFVIQSLMAYWFHERFGLEPAVLGGIFFGANIMAGISALSAAWIARRIGLINTMVFTHLPSNVLLILIPFMPTLPLAIAVLLLRFSISQMDVPTRQSYVMAVVAPEERSSAAGVTGIARTIGASLSPVITGVMLSNPGLASLPFLIAGSLKIVYDLIIWRSFSQVKPPEEQKTIV